MPKRTEKEWRELVIKVARQIKKGIDLSQDEAFKVARIWVHKNA
jgi:hypothetical protein